MNAEASGQSIALKGPLAISGATASITAPTISTSGQATHTGDMSVDATNIGLKAATAVVVEGNLTQSGAATLSSTTTTSTSMTTPAMTLTGSDTLELHSHTLTQQASDKIRLESDRLAEVVAPQLDISSTTTTHAGVLTQTGATTLKGTRL